MSPLRVLRLLFLPFVLAAATSASAEDITNASLEIQGSGLSVVTTEVTTPVDVPVTVQTSFGGKTNDEALTVPGLLAVGDLTGPGLDSPLELTTAPGHRFEIPGLSLDGTYTLQNVRLMKGREVLQYATPSSAMIIVADLFQAAVEVRQLTPDEIRARGIVVDARNYEVYEYTLSILIRGETVKIPFPVIIDPRTRQIQLMPVIDPYRLPPIGQIGVGRWTPPDVIPVQFSNDELPEEERNQPKEAKDPGEEVAVRPSIPAAIVIPNSLAVMHQFFAVALTVTNGAPDGSAARLENLSARIKVPSQLRTASSEPAVSLGQAVPIVDKKNGLTILVAQAKGEASWSVEALQPGTHTIEIELKGTLKQDGQADVPLVARPRASVVVHDPRFNIVFSHPDTVRAGIDYTTYTFVTNVGPTAQTIRLANDVFPCSDNRGGNVCRVDGGVSDEETIASGDTATFVYRLRPSVTGRVIATAAAIGSENAVATAQLHLGVAGEGDLAIPLSPTTLVMPHYAQYVDDTLVSQYLRLLGLGYSLATAPVTSATAKMPRVIKADVYRRAVDIAEAGQAIFITNGAPGSKRDALAGLALDLLGNRADLREWDALRRLQPYARPADAAIVTALAQEGLANGASFPSFMDDFAKATSHRNGYVAALVHGPEVANVARPYKLAIRGASSGRVTEVPSDTASGWVRNLPYADISSIAAGGHIGELGLVGRWTSEDLEIIVTPAAYGPFSLELLYPNTADGSTMRAHFDLNGVEGQTLRIPISRGATQLQALLLNGSFASSASPSAVALEPLRVAGMRQDLYLDENGHKVSVLFNRPVDAGVPAADVRGKFHGEVDFNKDGVVWMDQPRPISAAAQQESGTVVNLTFDHVLTTNANYTIEIDPLVDPRTGAAASFPGEYVPKIDNDRPAGIIYGKFLRSDNTPLADQEVILFSGVRDPGINSVFLTTDDGRKRWPANPYLQPEQIANTRADGSYLFEFVRREFDSPFDGQYRLFGSADGLTKYTYLDGSVRLPGRVHFVNLQLLGRGSAEGRVRYDNGEVAAGARVTIGSTVFEGVRTATTDATGFYRVEDLPVGPLAFTATDAAGNIGYAAGAIDTPGEIEQQDISIYRQPVPKNGSIHGIIRRSDNNAPVAGASVGIFNNGYPLFVLTTDSDGAYVAEKVPAGLVSVVAAEWSVSRVAANTDFNLRGDEVKQVDLTLSVVKDEPLVTVTGQVLREDPLYPGDATKYQPVAGALVKIYGMRIATADANGNFAIVDVPVSRGGGEIAAYDPETRRTQRATLPPLSETGANHIPILISGLGYGKVRALLLDARGNSVSSSEMLVKIGGAYFVMSGRGGGVYELDHVGVGSDFIVRTGATPDIYRHQEAASNPMRLAFDGQTVSVTLRLPGKGDVRARVKGRSIPADGGEPILTPLISEVSLSYPFFNSTTLQTEFETITRSTNQNGLPGDALFQNIPALKGYTVTSEHPLGHSSADGRLAYEGDLGDHTLTLNNLGQIAGVVYAIDGATPVPGASVRLDDGHQDQGVVVTGLDGKFVFQNVAPDARFRLIAESSQAGIYRIARREGVIPANGGLVTTSLTLLERGQIDGYVVYKAYKVYDPLNSANNVLDDTPADLSDNARVPMARFWLRELDFPSREMGTTTQPRSTDLAGRFAVDSVFVGRLRATAWSPDNPDLRGDWTAQLTREGELLTPYIAIGGGGTGTVVSTVADPNQLNAPVMNAEVYLYRDGGGANFVLFDVASTGADGTSRFEQVPVGTYRVTAYSKALGKSGKADADVAVTPDGVAEPRILLTFSGEVTGTLTDPEANPANAPVAGSHVTISMAEGFQQRFTTLGDGKYTFAGVREGPFSLDAKDSTTNRRARATGFLSAANPTPQVNLQLEPTATLHLAVYLPDDTGAKSNVLAGPVEATVSQRSGDFYRALQDNPIVMAGVLQNEGYAVHVQEIGGAARQFDFSGRFPKGSASDPIVLVYPAYGSLEVLVRRGGAPVADARVAVYMGDDRYRIFYSDSAGRVVATGLPLNRSYSITVTTLDGSSGSGSATVLRQSVMATATIEVGSRATLVGSVLAEAGGPSMFTPVVVKFPGGQLSGTTDADGRFRFAGIPAPASIELSYYGDDGSTLGYVLPLTLGGEWAGKEYTVPQVRIDATPPRLVDVVPAGGALDVPPDMHLRFVFSEPINTTTDVHGGVIRLSDFIKVQAADGTNVSAQFTWADGPNGTFIVTMKPDPPPAGQQYPLKSNMLHRLTVSANLTDRSGHPIGTPIGQTFTTADYVEPRVVATVPEAGMPVPEQITYELRFNEPLDPAPFRTGGAGVFLLEERYYEGETARWKKVEGNAYVDPITGISLYFAPAVATTPNTRYRATVSGVRDLQGNTITQAITYEWLSWDTIQPFLILSSPVPQDAWLTSGLVYRLTPEIRDGSAEAKPAEDVAAVDYFRVENGTETFLRSVKTAPFAYEFVAPDASASGLPLVFKAVARDRSSNESAPVTLALSVKPNQPPVVAVSLDRTAGVYAGETVRTTVTTSDEGKDINLQLDVSATRADGSQYRKLDALTVHRNAVADSWPVSEVPVALPENLKGGSEVLVKAIATDMSGLTRTAQATLVLATDSTPPSIVSVTPSEWTELSFGATYQVAATVTDVGSGVAEVSFQVEGTTYTVPRSASVAGVFTTPAITVTAHSVNTTVPITITAKDYAGSTASRTFNVVYLAVDDPTVPTGEWLCPISGAVLPANMNAFSLKLRVRAADDVSVTAVRFRLPGVETLVTAQEEQPGEFAATVTIDTPPADTADYAITAIVSDADPSHTQEYRLRLSFVTPDVVVDSTQAIVSSSVATYEDKTVLVRGAQGRLVPHVPVRLRNLLVIDGARVDTLPTTTTTERRLELSITDNLYVDCASSIDVSGLGYLGAHKSNADGSGTGNNSDSGMTLGNTIEGGAKDAGGSHAGVGLAGYNAPNAPFGSYAEPRTLGAGGGSQYPSGNGGGAIALSGSGARFVIAGAVRADGETGGQLSGGGAGGSVLLQAADVLIGGAGRIAANGGDMLAGGGGRVAIFATRTLNLPANAVQARGGRNHNGESTGTRDGGAGTVYVVRPGETDGDLVVSAFDSRYPATVHDARYTPLGTNETELVFRTINVGPHAVLRMDRPYRVTQTDGIKVDATGLLVGPDIQPSVSFTTVPAAGSTIWQNAAIHLTYEGASQDGVAEVRIIVPGRADRVDAFGTYPAAVGPTGFDFTVPSNTTPGPFIVTVRATSRSGRVFESTAAYTVTADVAPTVAFQDVTTSRTPFYAGGTIGVSGAAADDVEVKTLNLASSVNGVTAQPPVRPTPRTMTREFTVAVPQTTPSGTSVALTLSTSDGFPGRADVTAQQTVIIQPDPSAPTVTITKPVANQQIAEVTNGTFTLEVAASDGEVGVKTVAATFEGTSYTLAPVAGQPGLYSATLPIPPVEGSDPVAKMVTVTVSDFEPNVTTSAVTFYVVPLVDPNAPKVSWICGSTNAIYPSGYAVPLRVLATGTNGIAVQSVSFTVNGGDPIAAPPVSTGSNEYAATFTVPAGTAAGSVFHVRALGVSQSGAEATLLSTFTVVAGVDAPATITAGDLSLENATLFVRSTTAITGPHTFKDLVVLSGGKLVQQHVNRLSADALRVDHFFVACGATVDVTGLGLLNNTAYPAAGVAEVASGGSHIGRGGVWDRMAGGVFDSVFEPKAPGGGGNVPRTSVPAGTGVGGGSVRVHASGSVTIDGTVRADGTASSHGGGAGGSIWITSGDLLTGSGQFQAIGANTPYGGPGGGGAVSLQYATTSGTFTTNVKGGTSGNDSARHAAAGTVLRRTASGNGDLTIDNSNILISPTSATELPAFGRATVATTNANAVVLAQRMYVSTSLAGHRVRAYAPDGSERGLYRIATVTPPATFVTFDGGVDVNTQDAVDYEGYLLYTPVGLGGKKFVAVRRNGAQWQYDNDSAFVDFTPAPGDALFASFAKTGNRFRRLDLLRCCDAVEGLPVLEVVSGEIVPDAANWTSGDGPNTAKWETNAGELYLEQDGFRRAFVLVNGAPSITLEKLSGADVQAGDGLRGVYQFDNVRLVNAQVVSEDLVEIANALQKDSTSSLTGGNISAPAVDVSKVTIAAGVNGPVVVGSAGAVVDLDGARDVLVRNTAFVSPKTPSLRVAYAAGGTEGGLSLTHLENARTGGNATTVEAINGEGYLAFSPSQTNANLQVGLAPNDTTAGYNEPGHNTFRLKNDGTYEVWSNGTNTGKTGAYASNTNFRIEKSATSLRWLVENTVVHEVTSNLPASLVLDVSWEQSSTGEIAGIEVGNLLPARSLRAQVNADGSFRVPILAAPGDELRLRARDRHVYSFESEDVAVGAVPVDMGIASVTLAPASVTGGRSATGTVTLRSAAGSEGALITLQSPSPDITLPASITIPANASSGTFVVTTRPVVASTSAAITATWGGVAIAGALQVVPDTLAPAVTITKPVANAEFVEGAAGGIAIEVSVVEEDSGIASVTAAIDATAVALTKNTAKGPNVYTGTIAVPFVDATTTKNLVVTALDNNNNSGTATVSVVIRPVEDVTPPTLTWSCFSSGGMYAVGDAVPLIVTAVPPPPPSALQSVQFFVTDPSGTTASFTPSALPNNQYQVLYTVPSAADGAAFSVRVVATSVAGVTAEETRTFTAIAEAMKITASKTIAATDTTYEGKSVVITGGTTTITGTHTFKRLVVYAGASVTHATGDRLDVQTTEGVFVACNASIDVSDKGYGANITHPDATKPGFATAGSHMGYGGLNSAPYGSTYGSVYRPAEAGAGGQRFGSGGGIVRIQAGTLTNDGAIRANGTTTDDSSAGGSIWITATNVGGSGTIQARGGNGYRGGGGGAVAVEYATTTGTLLTADSQGRLTNVDAFGGTQGSTVIGGAGTVYLRTASSLGHLIVDAGTGNGATTDLPALGSGVAQPGTGGAVLVTGRMPNVPSYFVGHWVRITNAGGMVKGTWRIGSPISGSTVTLVPNGNESIDVVANDRWQGVYRFDDVTLRNVVLVSTDPIEAGDQSLSGPVTMTSLRATNLELKPGATLTHPALGRLDIVVTGELKINSGAAIDVSSKGYDTNTTHPDATKPGFATAGSHMGYGGLNSAPYGSTYGSVYQPAEAGAGGQRFGSGGGIVRIQAGTLTNDGAIRANGTTTDDSSAGGSIWITATNVGGSGTIQARGGNGYRGGGGGAVAVEYATATGTLLNGADAFGGTQGSTVPGGAGTLCLREGSSPFGNLTIKNGGANGARTVLPSLGTGSAITGSSGATLVTNRVSNVPQYFRGHWVEVRDANGTLKGTWRIGIVDGKSVTLLPNGSETVDVQPGDSYQGVYRFDNVMLRTTTVSSGDPIRSTNPIDAGSTVLDINDGPPVFPAAKRGQIVVESALTGDAVTGPAGAVVDPSTPIVLTVTNVRTGAKLTANANADGSFRVPVSGQPGDTFTIAATDSHAIPLSSAPIAVNGSIVETNTITSFGIQPATVTGGTIAYGSVRLAAPARALGTTLSVASSSGYASVPATVVIPGGAVSFQIPIQTISPVTTTDAVITATVGSSSAQAMVSIASASSVLTDLVLESSTVEGGTSVNGTIILGAPAPVGGAVVMLTSSAPQAGVPATVLVTEGNTQASFSIRTMTVASPTRVSISAAYGVTVTRDLDLTACTAMSTAASPASTPMSALWFDDAAPAGAIVSGDAAFDNSQVAAGASALHFAAAAGTRQWSFTTGASLTVTPTDRIVFYILVNPCNPPRQISLRWSDGANASHALWGESRAADVTATTIHAGAVPQGGEWQRVEVLAKTLGITTARNLTALTITVQGGELWLDAMGTTSCSLARAETPMYLPGEQVWFDDTLPTGAVPAGTYNWDNTQSASGSVADLVGTPTLTGETSNYFSSATAGFALNAEDVLVTYVLLDPCNPPREVMVQWNDGSGWNRRAYWGENLIAFGANRSVERRRMGPLPETGRWVRLEVPVSSMVMRGMTLRGVAFNVYGGRAWFDRVAKVSRVNLALNKTATQSSDYQNVASAALAVDGSIADNNNSHTTSSAQPWWQVDLGAVQPIESIDVWNVTGSCCSANRLQRFRVHVSDVPFTDSNLATTINQPEVSSYSFVNVAARPTTFEVHRTGRFVRVQLEGTNELHMSEVQVWAPVSAGLVNVGGGRRASQSSTYASLPADEANNANVIGTSNSHTNNDLEASWDVDLGSIQPISTIDIDNTIESPGWERLANVYLFVSDSALPATKKVADALAQPGVGAYFRMGPSTSYTFRVDRTGRYVRVQLTGTNYLHLQEVRIWAASRILGAFARPSDAAANAWSDPSADERPQAFDFARASRRARSAPRVASR